MSNVHLVKVPQALDQLEPNPLHFHLREWGVLLVVRKEISTSHQLEDHMPVFLLPDKVENTIDVGVIDALEHIDFIDVALLIFLGCLGVDLNSLASNLEPRSGAV
jgi:hypothetical protein